MYTHNVQLQRKEKEQYDNARIMTLLRRSNPSIIQGLRPVFISRGQLKRERH